MFLCKIEFVDAPGESVLREKNQPEQNSKKNSNWKINCNYKFALFVLFSDFGGGGKKENYDMKYDRFKKEAGKKRGAQNDAKNEV